MTSVEAVEQLLDQYLLDQQHLLDQQGNFPMWPSYDRFPKTVMELAKVALFEPSLWSDAIVSTHRYLQIQACSLRSQESTFVGRSEGRTSHPNGSLLAPVELRLLAESCWMLTKVSPRWRLSWLKRMALRAWISQRGGASLGTDHQALPHGFILAEASGEV